MGVSRHWVFRLPTFRLPAVELFLSKSSLLQIIELVLSDSLGIPARIIKSIILLVSFCAQALTLANSYTYLGGVHESHHCQRETCFAPADFLQLLGWVGLVRYGTFLWSLSIVIVMLSHDESASEM